MQSTLRLASCRYVRSRTQSARQIAKLKNDLKEAALNPARASCITHKTIHTDAKEGPLCQAESVKTQLKQVSNVDTPETIRKAWFHPEFPVEKMTSLLVSMIKLQIGIYCTDIIYSISKVLSLTNHSFCILY